MSGRLSVACRQQPAVDAHSTSKPNCSMYSYCIKIEDRSYFIKTMLRHIVPSWNARGKSISPSVYLREQWFRHLSLLLGASACSEQAQRELQYVPHVHKRRSTLWARSGCLLRTRACLFFRKRMHEKFTRDILQAAAVYFLPKQKEQYLDSIYSCLCPLRAWRTTTCLALLCT